MGLLSNLLSGASGGKGGTENVESSTLWTTPWHWRTENGLYIGFNGQAWLYRELPLHPLTWEDDQRKVEVGNALHQILGSIGDLSKGGAFGITANREIHVLSLTWEEMPEHDKNATPDFREYLEATLNFTVPRRTLVVGVRLEGSMVSSRTGQGTIANIKDKLVNLSGEGAPDLTRYDKDIAALDPIFVRNGASVPTRSTMAQMESWYNNGAGPDASLMEAKDLMYLNNNETLEMAAVMRFTNPVTHAPHVQWILDAASEEMATSVVSVRGELQPASAARARLRQAQRKLINQVAEQAATEDLERAEDSSALQLAQDVENFFVSSREPQLSDCSIIMARRGSDGDGEGSTYIDMLKDRHGIEVKALEHRQLAAMDETLPCSAKRVNPFLQDVSLSVLAYAGISGFSNLGDKKGIFVGLTDPDLTPCYLDVDAAPEERLPPATAIFGDSGSGKTFLSQMISTQGTLDKKNVIYVNPKGFSTLSPTADLVGGRVVKMSAAEKEPGAFDPFVFMQRDAESLKIAADILINHIFSCTGDFFNQEQRLDIRSGIQRAAANGVVCGQDAIQAILNSDVVYNLERLIGSSSLFALAFAPQRRVAFLRAFSGMTLIEFDRQLDLPEASTPPNMYSDEQRYALAAIRLVTTASMELLNQTKGGIFILDEAWTFLGSSEGVALLQRLGRLGRSQNILPIYATQRVDDLLKAGVDLASYISRVFVMKLSEEKEARAALHFCGLKATQGRLDWLKAAGSRRPSEAEPNGRAAYALHRDLYNRHSAIMVGPVPPAAAEAFSTNPKDLEERLAREEEEKIIAAKAAEEPAFPFFA